MKLNEKIIMLRITNGLSVEELSRRLNIEVELLDKVEDGIEVPSMTLVQEIAKEFEVSFDLLLNDDVDLVVTKEGKTPSSRKERIDEHAGRIISWSIAGFFMIPVAVIGLTFLIMILGIGGLFVGLLPALALASIAGAAYSIYHMIFISATNAEMIMSIGGLLIGTGLVFPLIKASFAWFKNYRKTSKKVTDRIKNFKISEWVK